MAYPLNSVTSSIATVNTSAINITPNVSSQTSQANMVQKGELFENSTPINARKIKDISKNDFIEMHKAKIIETCNKRGIKICKSFITMMNTLKTNNSSRLQTKDDLELFFNKINCFFKNISLTSPHKISTAILENMVLLPNQKYFSNSVNILDISDEDLKKIAQYEYIFELSIMYRGQGMVTCEIIDYFRDFVKTVSDKFELNSNKQSDIADCIYHISVMCRNQKIPNKTVLNDFLDNPRLNNKDGTINYDLVCYICKMQYHRGILNKTVLNDFLDNPRLNNKDGTINYDLVCYICKIQSYRGVPSKTVLNDFLDNPRLKNKDGTTNYNLIKIIYKMQYKKGIPDKVALNNFLDNPKLKNKDGTINYNLINIIDKMQSLRGIPSKTALNDFLDNPRLKNKDGTTNYNLIEMIYNIQLQKGIPRKTVLNVFLDNPRLKNKDGTTNYNLIDIICNMQFHRGIPSKTALNDFLDNPRLKNKDGTTNYNLIYIICKMQFHRGIPSKTALNDFLDNPKLKNKDGTTNHNLIDMIYKMQSQKGIPSKTVLNDFLDNPRLKNKDGTTSYNLIDIICNMQFHRGIPSKTALNDFLDNPRLKNKDGTTNYNLIDMICNMQFHRGIPSKTALNDFLDNPRLKNKDATINYNLIDRIYKMQLQKGIPRTTVLNDFLDNPRLKNKDGTTNYDLISSITINRYKQEIPNIKELDKILTTIDISKKRKANSISKNDDSRRNNDLIDNNKRTRQEANNRGATPLEISPYAPENNLVSSEFIENRDDDLNMIYSQPYNGNTSQTEELPSCKKINIEEQTINTRKIKDISRNDFIEMHKAKIIKTCNERKIKIYPSFITMMDLLKITNNSRLQSKDDLEIFFNKINCFFENMSLTSPHKISTAILTNMVLCTHKKYFSNNVNILDISDEDLKKIAQYEYIFELSIMYSVKGMVTCEIIDSFRDLVKIVSDKFELNSNKQSSIVGCIYYISLMCLEKEIPSKTILNDFLNNPKFKNKDDTINYELVCYICRMQSQIGIPSKTVLNNFLDNPRLKNKDGTTNYNLVFYICGIQFRKGIPSTTVLNDFLDNPRLKNKDGTTNNNLIDIIYKMQYKKGIPDKVALNNFLDNPKLKNKDGTINYNLIDIINTMQIQRGIPSKTVLNDFLDNPKLKNKDGTTNYKLIKSIASKRYRQKIPNIEELDKILKTIYMPKKRKANSISKNNDSRRNNDLIASTNNIRATPLEISYNTPENNLVEGEFIENSTDDLNIISSQHYNIDTSQTEELPSCEKINIEEQTIFCKDLLSKLNQLETLPGSYEDSTTTKTFIGKKIDELSKQQNFIFDNDIAMWLLDKFEAYKHLLSLIQVEILLNKIPRENTEIKKKWTNIHEEIRQVEYIRSSLNGLLDIPEDMYSSFSESISKKSENREANSMFKNDDTNQTEESPSCKKPRIDEQTIFCKKVLSELCQLEKSFSSYEDSITIEIFLGKTIDELPKHFIFNNDIAMWLLDRFEAYQHLLSLSQVEILLNKIPCENTEIIKKWDKIFEEKLIQDIKEVFEVLPYTPHSNKVELTIPENTNNGDLLNF